MNRKYILYAFLALGSFTVWADINSPQIDGYQSRAQFMLSQGDFQGCLDQCSMGLRLAGAPRQSLQWLQAVAAYNGGLPEAQKLLNGYVGRYPASDNVTTARLMLATIEFRRGNYAVALKQLNEIDPQALGLDQAEDWAYRKAFSLMKLHDYEPAAAMFQTLAQAKRYKDAALFYEGYIAFVEGEYDYALDLFDKCDKAAEPGNKAAYYIAQILFRQEKYAEAINVLMPLLSRQDVPAEFADEMKRIAGESFYALNDDDKAMGYLNPYIAAHPDDAPLSTRYIVGVERYQTGEFEQALEFLAPVSNIQDKMGQSALLTMGQAYMALGNSKSAIMMFDKATRHDFSPAVTELAYYNHAVAQADGGRIPFGNTVQTLENFLKRYPNSRYASQVREHLIKGYMATDDYPGALRSLNSIGIEKSPSLNAARQRVNFVLGTRELQAGNADRAIIYLKEAEKFNGADAEIARQTELWLGDALYAKGDYPASAAQYRRYLAKASVNDINRAAAQYNLAYALFEARQYTEARKAFETVSTNKQQAANLRADAYNRTGDTYYYQKQLTDAIVAYRSAYQTDKKSGDYSLLQIAMMEGHLGNQGEKIGNLSDLISKYPSSPLRPTAMTEKALANVVLGKPKQAIEEYKVLAASYPQTQLGRDALLQLAILSDNTGDARSADAYYRQIVSQYPTSAESALAVQDLKRIYGDAGRIEELNAFLESIEGAPQLEATERNAIAAASLLRKAKNATSADSRAAAANEIITNYPDAAESYEALQIAAKANMELGLADKALSAYSKLEERSANASARHWARLGILRAAVEMNDHNRVISAAENVLADNLGDHQEAKFFLANSLNATGQTARASFLWSELSPSPTTVYGCRSAYELANLDFCAGRFEQAAAKAEAIIDANPPHAYWLARTFILYSDILRAQGSDFEADEYLKILRSNYPGTDDDIYRMIDKRLPK